MDLILSSKSLIFSKLMGYEKNHQKSDDIVWCESITPNKRTINNVSIFSCDLAIVRKQLIL